MAVTIQSVVPHSPADRLGIQEGEVLLQLNGKEIRDMLDYQFYMTNQFLTIEMEDRTLSLSKGEYEDLGLVFATYLIDKQQSCKNKCIFCFVDQMPKGMRSSLYFKDDDSRMSFLFGNYITLTNLKEEEIDRIIQMRISPINISVHTTNPDLRVKMMANPRAAETLAYLQKLAEGGIKMNTQLVLCPGVNDGEELSRSLKQLGQLYPHLQTISCVPVGITSHREGLSLLTPYTKEQATKTIAIIEAFSAEMEEQHGERLAYPADEFFLKAELPIPPSSYYGDFNQLENGVGLLALLMEEFASALKLAEPSQAKRQISLATGEAAYPFLLQCAKEAMECYPQLVVHVYPIRNDFFGHTITVAGLVTGQDLIAQLQGKPLGEQLLLPSVMLKHEENCFLDDITREQLENILQVSVRMVENDGFQLLEAMTPNPDISA